MVSKSSFRPEPKELVNFVVASLVISLGFAAFEGSFGLANIVTIVLLSSLCLILRDFGQRLAAAKATGQTYLELSVPGTMITIVTAFVSLVSSFDLLMLIPVYSTFDGIRHEEWGKSTDAMWMKRQNWIVGTGIFFMLAGTGLLSYYGQDSLANYAAIFTAYQLLPFDFEELAQVAPGVDGWEQVLDGAYLLRLDSWRWMLLTGLSLIAVALT